MDNRLYKAIQGQSLRELQQQNRLAQMTHTQGYSNRLNPNDAFTNTSEAFAHGIYNAPGNLARLMESMPDYQGPAGQYSNPIDQFTGADLLNEEFTPETGWQKSMSFAGEALADPTMIAGTPLAALKAARFAPQGIRNLSRTPDGAFSPMRREMSVNDIDWYSQGAEDYRRYSTLPDSDGGRILNTDVARELFPEYVADRTRSADVHEDASAIVKNIYARKLNELPGQDANEVMFTAGGTGAGKSSSLSALGDTKQQPQIIYDTNMNGYESSKKKIEQAIQSGRTADIVLVDRDPVDALVNGALPRAERQIAKFGTGRTVPLGEHLKTHIGSRSTVKRLADEYADNPMVNIKVIDNNRGRDNAALGLLGDVTEINRNEVAPNLYHALMSEYEKGNISRETFEGFLNTPQR